jgi:transcriptional regulator with XRE-family HTH domain
MADVIEFGNYFRQRRMAMGLSLREFCRRNGFDQGNVSRMERGLTPAPRSQALLEAYAQSLRLTAASPEWNDFMSLASIESVALPQPIQKNAVVRARLRAQLKAESGRQAVGYALWTHARDLELWAGMVDARYTLPQLVRRLVHATVPGTHIEEICFRAFEGADLQGWDGLLRTSSGNALVPPGASVWELSCEEDPAKKVNKVLRERTSAPLGAVPRNCTFVFLTPRRWPGKRKWLADVAAKTPWRQVRAYDAQDLEQWLELAPAVDAWFAGLMGRPVQGVVALASHWEALARLSGTKMRLMPELFLLSRKKQADALKAWLAGTNPPLLVEAAPSDTVDFIAAYVADLPEKEADAVASRALVVENRDSWRHLAREGNARLLLVRPPLQLEPQDIAEAIGNGHRVILTTTAYKTDSVQTIELGRVYRHEIRAALQKSGFPDRDAERFAEESGGSLTVLKRRLMPSSNLPKWADNPDSAILSLLLAEQWDESSEKDRRLLEFLAGRPYEEVAQTAERLARMPDPPVLKILSRWSLVSPADAWLLLGKHVTSSDLARFENAAVTVLAEDNPALDMPDTAIETVMAALLEAPSSRHSTRLRMGLSTSMAFLATSCRPTCVNNVVRRTFSPDHDWRRWASLSDVLAILAEASPEPFLAALEASAADADKGCLRLFTNRTGRPFSASCHHGLLRALRILAWNPDYFGRVALLLASLAEKGADDPSAVGLIGSLQGMFNFAGPGTATPEPKRRRILLEVLPAKAPDVAWRLQVKLLQIAAPDTNSCQPRWHTWGEGCPLSLTWGEYWQQHDACLAHLLSTAGTTPGHWRDLIEHLPHLAPPERDQVIKSLSAIQPESFGAEGRRQLADVLRRMICFHRRLGDAPWVLPDGVLDQLSGIQERLTPTELVERHAWLFAPNAPMETTSEQARTSTLTRLDEQCVHAVEEIFRQLGLDGVLRLARQAPQPGRVGTALGKSGLPVTESVILPDMLASDDQCVSGFAAGYAQARFEVTGHDWLAGIPLRQWHAKNSGTLLACLAWRSRDRRLWDLAAQLGDDVRTVFWSKLDWGTCETQGDLDYAIRQFLGVEQPFVAAEVLFTNIDFVRTTSPDLLMDVLASSLNHQNDMKTVAGQEKQMCTYFLRELFAGLQERYDRLSDDQKARLSSLEWSYLSLLDGISAQPRGLFKHFAEHPEGFAEVVSWVYRSSNDSADCVTRTDEQERLAEQGLHVLMAWTQQGAIPGRKDDGAVDYDVALNWIRRAREACKATGRLSICDLKIGEALGACKDTDSDGVWPCEAIRDVIEEIASEDLDRGTAIGQFNSTGVQTRSLEGGGTPERETARKFRAWADKCDVSWPRTAKVLRQMATSCEYDADIEDAWAEGRK